MSRRLPPKVFTLLAALSLLPCLVLVVLWLRNSPSDDSFEFQRGGWVWEAVCRDGRLWIDNDPQRSAEHWDYEYRYDKAREAYLNAQAEMQWALRHPEEMVSSERWAQWG